MGQKFTIAWPDTLLLCIITFSPWQQVILYSDNTMSYIGVAMGGKKFLLGRARKNTSHSCKKVPGRPQKKLKQIKVTIAL